MQDNPNPTEYPVQGIHPLRELVKRPKLITQVSYCQICKFVSLRIDGCPNGHQTPRGGMIPAQLVVITGRWN